MIHALEIFNKYAQVGGEEIIADRILSLIRTRYSVESIRWDSKSWQGASGPSLPGQVLRMFHNWESRREICSAIQKNMPAFILCHNIYPIGSPSVYMAAIKAGVPIIQFIHNFRPFSVSGTLWTGDRVAESGLDGDFKDEILAGAWQSSRVKSLVMGGVLKFQNATGALGAVHKWVAVSDFMKAKFVAAGIPESRITTLRHFWPISNNRSSPVDGGYYLFLGRLVVEKGVRTLIDAWKFMFTRMGDSCPDLVICGDGPLKAEVQAAAMASPVIKFMGYVGGSDKQTILRRARAVVAPSIWWEPLGLVAYESYHYSKPILASKSGGLQEVVFQNMTGLLHTPGDAEGLAADVIKMEALNDEARREMGNAGYVWLLENASPEVWLSAFDQIVSSVV